MARISELNKTATLADEDLFVVEVNSEGTKAIAYSDLYSAIGDKVKTVVEVATDDDVTEFISKTFG